MVPLCKILNINWNGNYKGKELEYWNRYYCFLNILNIILYLIIIIIFIIFVYTIHVKSKSLKISFEKCYKYLPYYNL
jgi:uncharacterized membrane protein